MKVNSRHPTVILSRFHKNKLNVWFILSFIAENSLKKMFRKCPNHRKNAVHHIKRMSQDHTRSGSIHKMWDRASDYNCCGNNVVYYIFFLFSQQLQTTFYVFLFFLYFFFFFEKIKTRVCLLQFWIALKWPLEALWRHAKFKIVSTCDVNVNKPLWEAVIWKKTRSLNDPVFRPGCKKLNWLNAESLISIWATT